MAMFTIGAALLWSSVGFAGVTGTVAGKPFEAVSAIAGKGPYPGQLSVTLADHKLHCGDGESTNAITLYLGFSPVVGAAAAPSGLVMTGAAGTGPAKVTGELTRLPAVVGERGQLRIDSWVGKSSDLSGYMPFTLCDVLPTPAPPESLWAVETVKRPGATVRMGMPSEWAIREVGNETEYVAQDGRTYFAVTTMCRDFPCDPALWGSPFTPWVRDDLPWMFAGRQSLDRVSAEHPSENVSVIRYNFTSTFDQAAILDVFLMSQDEDVVVHCLGSTPLDTVAYLDVMKQVCLQATLVRVKAPRPR